MCPRSGFSTLDKNPAPGNPSCRICAGMRNTYSEGRGLRIFQRSGGVSAGKGRGGKLEGKPSPGATCLRAPDRPDLVWSGTIVDRGARGGPRFHSRRIHRTRHFCLPAATMGKRTKKVGITGKYGTRYGASIRKVLRKIEISQHAKYTCPFCGKLSMKRKVVGIWNCSACKKTIAGGAFQLS